MKKYYIIICFIFTILCQGYSQINRDSALSIVKTTVLNNIWEDREIFSKILIVQPNDTILTLDSFLISPNYTSWLFFVDEIPLANWGHRCKYIFVNNINGESNTADMYMPPKITYGYEIVNRVIPSYKSNKNDLFTITRQRDIISTNTEYAVIISGGIDSAYNFARYWNDCSAIYQVLVNIYGYNRNKIFVLMANGSLSYYNENNQFFPICEVYPDDLDGDDTDDIQYAATANNISIVFDSLSRIMTPFDNLFIFVTDHGNRGSTINLWNSHMTKEQFAAEINKVSFVNTINICMEQCFSGGFTSALSGNRRVITTACASNENSWQMSNNLYDEFCYHWISAVAGFTPTGITINADYDNNGFVSMKEAFIYAQTNDSKNETPQYYSNLNCLGESLALNGIFDNSCLQTDLYVRDTITDNGAEPSLVRYQWNSPDIWIEDVAGNITQPIGNSLCYICVRVHNRSNKPSNGNERLLLNWAKAGVNLVWNNSWTGNAYFSCGQPKGGFIDSAFIPVIPAYGYVDVKIPWQVPSLTAYDECTEFGGDKWHFCLLARVHDGYPIAHENDIFTSVYQMTLDHNNVAWKNLYLLDDANAPSCVSISNISNSIRRYLLKLHKHSGIEITDYAEIYLTFDEGLRSAVSIEEGSVIGANWVSENTLRIISGDDASIIINMPANSHYTMQTTIHFLADQIPDSNNFDFDIVLYDEGENILGGEHFHCVRTSGRYFQAIAHDDVTIISGQTATLTAEDINELATYEWFDNIGNSIGNGPICYVNPQQTKTYRLCITADIDGYRAYDQVTITVQQNIITSITPNPTNSQVAINYQLLDSVTSATIQILNSNGQVVYSQIVCNNNRSQITNQIFVNTSSFTTGNYTVRMVSSSGKVHDSKTLIVIR
jgi:hypothetical protein